MHFTGIKYIFWENITNKHLKRSALQQAIKTGFMWQGFGGHNCTFIL